MLWLTSNHSFPLAGSVPPWPPRTRDGQDAACPRASRGGRPGTCLARMDHMSPEHTASMTTTAGPLVLAVATFGSTRSANRASRIAERSLLATLRPLLVHDELGDPR